MTQAAPATLKEFMNTQPDHIRIQRVRDWFEDKGSRAEIATYSHACLLDMAERLENPGFWRTQSHTPWLANPFGPILDRRNLRFA